MNLSDFDFDLPENLIATRPARPRTAAKLLLAQGARITDAHVHDLPQILRRGDRLVLNNTRVIPARLFGTRQRGEAVAKVEITLLEPQPQGWRALAKPLRKVNTGEIIRFSDALHATSLRQVRNRPAPVLQPERRCFRYRPRRRRPDASAALYRRQTAR